MRKVWLADFGTWDDAYETAFYLAGMWERVFVRQARPGVWSVWAR
jgi:hypothetical protein